MRLSLHNLLELHYMLLHTLPFAFTARNHYRRIPAPNPMKIAKVACLQLSIVTQVYTDKEWTRSYQLYWRGFLIPDSDCHYAGPHACTATNFKPLQRLSCYWGPRQEGIGSHFQGKGRHNKNDPGALICTSVQLLLDEPSKRKKSPCTSTRSDFSTPTSHHSTKFNYHSIYVVLYRKSSYTRYSKECQVGYIMHGSISCS